MIDSSNIIGLFGVFLILYSYYRVQCQREYVKTLSYSLCNLMGGTFQVISLCINWNLPAFISNVIWAFLSAYGVYRCFKYIWKARTISATPQNKAEAPFITK
jgi:hypothetical protein